MNKIKLICISLAALLTTAAHADEGMWMLQLMKQQHLIEQMKKQGLRLEAEDIYSPDALAIKDAVGIFGRGCTGEIVSADGLVLTNHHCGFDAIQKNSSVEHDYLKNGFWSKSRTEELPSEGLTFTFIEKIQNVTERVNQYMKENHLDDATFLSKHLNKLEDLLFEESGMKGKAGMTAELLPFFAGNQYYFFLEKVYSDLRMVAAPPQCIGKFGGETDNWMWPRHTCDFSMFRIYADANGEPAEYSPNNVPLQCKKHLPISLKGIQDGDFAMVIGFPGSTERYLTASEVESRMRTENDPRIAIRGARQEVLKAEMAASDKVRIQYAAKYASSSNYWKNSIGMNKAIVDNKVLELKRAQEQRFAEYAQAKNNAEYASVVAKIDSLIASSNDFNYSLYVFSEVLRPIEFLSPYTTLDRMKEAINKKDNKAIAEIGDQLKKSYAQIHNKDYDHEVDRKVAKKLLPLYAEMSQDRPSFFEIIEKEYKNDYDRFVDDLYDNSILASEENLNKFLKKPTVKAIEQDLRDRMTASIMKYRKGLMSTYYKNDAAMEPLHKTYVRGLCEMYEPTPKSADANFTMRLTYGNVKSYNPKDGVHYNYFTTLKGVMEKEDPNNDEFIVPEKLKQLYAEKDYGQYADADGELHTCFLTTNDITGGNSGSPVINGDGELIGAAFDGNWESLSGDIHFDNELQRCIAVDIRYVLFIIDKFGNCPQLIEEMTIVK